VAADMEKITLKFDNCKDSWHCKKQIMQEHKAKMLDWSEN